VRRNLLRGLPRIDSKYFYDDAGSHLFEEITRLPEYYQTRTEEALLAEIADDVVGLTGARELIELGSGAGRKIRLLLDAMRRVGNLERCVLLDINETFLRISAEELADCYTEAEIRGVVGDFLHDLEAVGTGDRRLFIFLAGTIGNLYPRQLTSFLRGVRAVLGPNDAFLVGLDLVKDVGRLEAAYNDSAGVTADFNLNALRVLNRRFETAFEINAFGHVAFYDRDRQWIEMRLRATRSTRASLGGGRALLFRVGDEIRTEISRKFTRRSFAAALDGAGLELSAWFTDPENLFASALVRPIGRSSSQ
jgi:L-histidine N-alpha-methyltransferase